MSTFVKFICRWNIESLTQIPFAVMNFKFRFPELVLGGSLEIDLSHLKETTQYPEHGARLLSTPLSYSSSPAFNSRPGDQLFWPTVFVVY
jgi:hypothetical protein